MSRKRYAKEFKLEAVKMVLEQSLTINQVGQDLGVSANILGRWKKQYLEDPNFAFPGKGKLEPQVEEKRNVRRLNLFLGISFLLLAAISAEAGVKEIVITNVESAFAGRSFDSVGPYEKLEGIMRIEIDPLHPLNFDITNIHKAPHNHRGMIEFDVDFLVLKPVDLKKGNGKILYDLVNRGNGLAIGTFNGGRGGSLSSANDAGDGFLMNRGYTLVLSGWQARYPIPDAPAFSIALASRLPGKSGMAARLPIARNQDGSPIVALSREEISAAGTNNTFIGYLTYPAASPDAKATLTVRQRELDEPQTPPGLTWRYLDEFRIEITRPAGEKFDAGAIYTFIYQAKDPIVYGLALASIRDVVSFFRYAVKDELGNANPLAPGGRPAITKTLAFGASQTGRTLKTLIYQFNEDENGRIVFDGVNIHISGASMNSLNYQFAQPGTKSAWHGDRRERGNQFPFTYTTFYDPISRRVDGLLQRCEATNTCPKIVHTDSENEVWQGAASLVYTDTSGRDIILPPNVRVYLFNSTQHGPAMAMNRGICQHLPNPLNHRPLSRALFAALDDWVSGRSEPPPSRYPKVQDGTLVPFSKAEFPEIPSVAFSEVINRIHLTDFSVQPPLEGAAYPIFVPKTDKDGNSLGGIRLPGLEVPTATYTGWNLRSAGNGEGDLCTASGSYISFAQTKDERLASGDPRLSLEERYANHDAYVKAISLAADRLVRERFLLEEDARQIKEAAAASGIGIMKDR